MTHFFAHPKRYICWSFLPICLLYAFFLGSGLLICLYESLGFLVNPGAAPNVESFQMLFDDRRLTQGIWFGLYLSFVSSVLSVVGGTLLALCLDKVYEVKKWTITVARLPVALPHILAIVILSQFLSGSSLPMRILNHLGLVEAPGEGLLHIVPGFGVLVVYIWKGLPFVFISICIRLGNINPIIWEAAQDLGATPLQTTLHIIIPMLKKTLLGLFALLAAFSFCSFEVPYLIGPTSPRTLPVIVFALYGTPGLEARAVAMAASALLLFLSLFLFVFFHHVTKEPSSR